MQPTDRVRRPPARTAKAGDVAEWLRQRPAKPCIRVRFPTSPRQKTWSQGWKQPCGHGMITKICSSSSGPAFWASQSKQPDPVDSACDSDRQAAGTKRPNRPINHGPWSMGLGRGPVVTGRTEVDRGPQSIVCLKKSLPTTDASSAPTAHSSPTADHRDRIPNFRHRTLAS